MIGYRLMIFSENFFKVKITLFCVLLFSLATFAQENEKELKKIVTETTRLLRSANTELKSDNFSAAEVDLRKAIALSPEDETGKYNLGNAYYNKDLNDEAMRQFVQAAGVADSKGDRHTAYHNLGNTFMNSKKYQEAVGAYKNALRNNPRDDETRYNLALAKDMLEKNPPEGDGDDDKNEDNKDKDKEESEDKKDKKDDKGDNKEGDDGDEKENEDKGDEKDENKEGDNKKDKGNPKDPNEEKDGEGEKPKQQQPSPGQLSPQQVKNLLEAMSNEEKKVQKKMNAKKQKGAKVKTNKDW